MPAESQVLMKEREPTVFEVVEENEVFRIRIKIKIIPRTTGSDFAEVSSDIWRGKCRQENMKKQAYSLG